MPMTTPSVLPPAPSARVDPVPLIAANIAPIAGMLFLDWSPPDLVAMYSVDTFLTLCALMWLVMEHLTEAGSPDRGVKRALKLGLSSLVGGVFLSFILIGPMAIMFADSEWVRQAPWRNGGFQSALALQAVGSLYALVRTHRMLNERNDDEPYLKQQFQFLVARWVVVLGVVFVGLAPIFGETFGSALIVLAYAGATVWFTMFPDRAHRMFFPDKPAPPAK
jgi:hypothetical protein